MALRLSERLQAVVFVAILTAAIAGLYATAQLLQPDPVTRSEVLSVRLDVQGSGWSIPYRPEATTNNTVFHLLLEASVRLGFSVDYVHYEIPEGIFVLGINGSTNGDGGRYWQYWVNSVYGTVAADHRALGDGDAVQWRYAVPEEGG
jgi:hypothetical protein